MIIISLYTRGRLLETDVVETSETRPVNVLDRVVRNQEVFLPPHEHKVRLLQLFIVETVRVEVFRVLVKGKEFALKTQAIKLYPLKSNSYFFSPNVSCQHPRQHPTFS